MQIRHSCSHRSLENKDKGETWAELTPDLGPTIKGKLVSATFVGMLTPRGSAESLGRETECSHLSQEGLLSFSHLFILLFIWSDFLHSWLLVNEATWFTFVYLKQFWKATYPPEYFKDEIKISPSGGK